MSNGEGSPWCATFSASQLVAPFLLFLRLIFGPSIRACSRRVWSRHRNEFARLTIVGSGGSSGSASSSYNWSRGSALSGTWREPYDRVLAVQIEKHAVIVIPTFGCCRSDSLRRWLRFCEDVRLGWASCTKLYQESSYILS